MSQPRRRLLRPIPSPMDDTRRQSQLHLRRTRLQTEQQSLARWMSRLRRAFHAVERQQRRVSRIEWEITRLERS